MADGDVDLANQYAQRDYAAFFPYVLEVDGRRTGGRVNEPHGVGFPLLIAPAYALGGPVAVELALAAVAALAFVLAAALARRLVPEPWATGGVVLVALSPPALAYSAAIGPELAAGALVCGAVLCALRLRESPRLRYAYGSALMLALVPWLGVRFAVAALPVAVLLVRWASRRGRRLAALGVAEVMVASVVALVTVNDVLYGGVTPYAADDPGASPLDTAFPFGYLERAPRLVALWIDRDYGLLRWAPIGALAFLAAWLLWRSRRERLADLVPARLDVEIAAALALAVCAAVVATATFAAPTIYGLWFPGRHLVAALPCAAALCAWGLRHAPRAGAVLGGLTVAGSAWLLVALRTGAAPGWADPDSAAPWGPAVDAFPRFDVGSAWAFALAAGALVGLVLLVGREWRHRLPAARATFTRR